MEISLGFSARFLTYCGGETLSKLLIISLVISVTYLACHIFLAIEAIW